MKYNIYINQQVLSKTNLDITDSSILDFIIFFCNSKSPKIQKKRKDGWTWLDYSELLRQMPLIKIKSKGALTPRIKKIEKAGYIETVREGRKLFIKLNDKVDELFIYMNDTVHENEQNRSFKRTNKDNKDKDNKIKVICDENIAGKDLNNLIDKFKEINPSWERLFSNKTQREALSRMVKKHGYEKMSNLLDVLPRIVSEPYAPNISTPYELEKKFGNLINFIKKNKKSKNNKSKNIIQ